MLPLSFMDSAQQKVMYIFPGQGAQSKGIGSDIYNDFACAKQRYDQASTIAGYDLAELSFRDPEQKLNKTRFTQPALLTHEIACLDVLTELTEGRVTPAILAGHSLGEYSALIASGALSFEDGFKLIIKRGELFSEYGRGKMIAIIKDREFVEPYADRFYCQIGGCNLPNQTVVGGKDTDITALVTALNTEMNGQLTTPLNTEGAFHTYLMIEAAEQLRLTLESTPFYAPRISVLSNYTGEFHSTNPDETRARLFFQMFHPVKWSSGMKVALDYGTTQVIELGGGVGDGDPSVKKPNLAGMMRKILRERSRGGLGDVPYFGGINTETLKTIAQSLIASDVISPSL